MLDNLAMNPYPTPREEIALKDVLRKPDASLAERLERLDSLKLAGRSGVLYLLNRLRKKGLVACEGGEWRVTLEGRKWLRPTLRSEA